jgi:hypothetical protein
MLQRYLLFLALLVVPIAVFAVHRPVLACSLPAAVVGAWWAASPVSYPKWVRHGLVRALPLAALESLALWWISR